MAKKNIALKNIRKQLATMCDGTMTTLSRAEEVTVVSVTIPNRGTE